MERLGPEMISLWLLYKNGTVVWCDAASSHGPSSNACQWRPLFCDTVLGSGNKLMLN